MLVKTAAIFFCLELKSCFCKVIKFIFLVHFEFKYREKQFVFLDKDGIPWNNNAEEGAISHLAVSKKNFLKLPDQILG